MITAVEISLEWVILGSHKGLAGSIKAAVQRFELGNGFIQLFGIIAELSL